MQKEYRLVNDPLYYITLGFFALLTTGMPAALGQPRFLPIIQTLGLFIFMSIAVRQRFARQGVIVMVIWLSIQLATMIMLTRFVPGQVDRAMSNGFQLRIAYTEWFYGVGSLPDSWLVQPLSRSIELAGVLLGSLLTGGLVGVWFLVRATNLAGYSIGALLIAVSGSNLPATVPLWTLARLAGYAGFVVLLAEPLWTGNWAIGYYWTHRRRLLVVSTMLLLLGLLLELAFPALWRDFLR